MNSVRTVRRLLLQPLWLFSRIAGLCGGGDCYRRCPSAQLGSLQASCCWSLVACLFPSRCGRETMLDRRLADRISWVGLTAMGFFLLSFRANSCCATFLLAGTQLFMSSETNSALDGTECSSGIVPHFFHDSGRADRCAAQTRHRRGAHSGDWFTACVAWIFDCAN